MASKVWERIYLDRFLQEVGWRPEHVEETERPDFILALGGARVGVELVELLKRETRRGSRMREEEAARFRTLKGIAKRYYDLGGPPLLLRVSRLPPRWKCPKALVAQFVETAEQLPVFGDARICESGSPRFTITRLPPELGEYRRWKCFDNNIGVVWALDGELLAAKIADKAPNVPEYRKRVDKLILLVIVDHGRSSGMFELLEPVEVDAGGFDEVWLLTYPMDARLVAVA